MATLTEWFNNLKRFQDYPIGEEQFLYKFEKGQDLCPFFETFSLEKVAGEGETFFKACRIMQWVEDTTQYDGESPLGLAMPDKIIEFGIMEKHPINCLNRAMLFCDALSTLGIFALPVWLGSRLYLSDKEQFSDDMHSHVIAQVWLPEKKCWAAFDPSFNTYYVMYKRKFLKRKEVIPISISKVVLRLIDGKPVRVMDNATGKKTLKGWLCAKIGLLNISVFPGNHLDYRKNWDSFDKRLFIVPDSYMEKVRVAEDKWQGWKDQMLNYTKITLNDLEGEP